MVALRAERRAILSAGSASVAFWIQVHDRLRRDAAGLDAAAEDYRSGRSTPAQLAIIASPRLRGLVAAMQDHHRIEDFEYFPEFRRAEPRLAAGFDSLEREHADLNRAVDAARAALAELHAAAERFADASADVTLKIAAQRYVDAAAQLCKELLRHLHDEENLVVPLLLERGAY